MEQRIIKFKAKLVNQNEWVEGDLLHTENLVFIVWIENGFRRLANVDPSTVCQFTSLKDQNGKEVWEGDVLSNHPFLEGEVSFYKGCLIVLRSDDSYVPLFEYINKEDPNVVELTNIDSKFDRKEEK